MNLSEWKTEPTEAIAHFTLRSLAHPKIKDGEFIQGLPELPRTAKGVLVRTVLGVDLRIANVADGSDGNKLFERLKTREELMNASDRLNQKLYEAITQNPGLIYFAHLHGATPNLARLISQFHGMNGLERIFPLVVYGTKNDRVIEPHFFTPYGRPQISVTPRSWALIGEELVDTAAASALSLVEWGNMTLGWPNNPAGMTLVRMLAKTQNTDFDGHRGLYQLIIDRAVATNALFSGLVWKNGPFLEELQDRVSTNRQTPWGQMEGPFTKDILVIGQNDWAMGGGADTPIEGKLLADAVVRDIGPDDIVSPLCHYLTNATVRIGSTSPGIFALRGGYSDFVQWSTRQFREELQSQLEFIK